MIVPRFEFVNLLFSLLLLLSTSFVVGENDEYDEGLVEYIPPSSSSWFNNNNNTKRKLDADVTILEANFDNGVEIDDGDIFVVDGFQYQPETFRKTKYKSYTRPKYSATAGYDNSGTIYIIMGGKDSKTTYDMSGGYIKQFTLSTYSNVNVKFRYKMIAKLNYNDDEYSVVHVGIDRDIREIKRIVGGDETSEWILYNENLGLLSPGIHTLMIGGYNNKKNVQKENTFLYFDDITLIATPTTI